MESYSREIELSTGQKATIDFEVDIATESIRYKVRGQDEEFSAVTRQSHNLGLAIQVATIDVDGIKVPASFQFWGHGADKPKSLSIVFDKPAMNDRDRQRVAAHARLQSPSFREQPKPSRWRDPPVDSPKKR